MSPFEEFPRRRRRALVGVLGAALATVAVSALVTPATAAGSARVVLPDSRRSGGPLDNGSAGTPVLPDPQRVLPLRIYFAGQNPAGRAAEVSAVSTPGSASYGAYLTPGQYEQRYGPTATQISGVSSWLRSQGMVITGTNDHFVAVNATIAQADAAFDTDIMQYDDDLAPVAGASVPAALAEDVATVTGLEKDTTADPTPPSVTPTDAATARTTAGTSTPTTAFPCSQFWAQHTAQIPEAFGLTTAPTTVCGYTPNQLQQAYGVAGDTHAGAGATIAVISDGRSPTMEADANQYFTKFGIPAFTPGQYTENLSPTFTSTCGTGASSLVEEEAMDVETAHLIAPGAKIVYAAADCAPDTEDTFQNDLDAETRVVDAHLADVTTGSFGFPEGFFSVAQTTAWNLTFQQGAVEGIGCDFSTGDGQDDSDVGRVPAEVNFPASSPWATAVGGTSLQIGSTGAPVGEYAWGDAEATLDPTSPNGYQETPPGSGTDGGGGGHSALFPQPAYQKNVVPAALATTGGTTPARRVTPDVSADAGLAWLIGYTGATTDGVFGLAAEGGGTSGSSPIVAAFEADADAAGGHAVGFVNPALYQLSGTPAFRDILPVDPTRPPVMVGTNTDAGPDPTLVTLGMDGSLKAAVGYDDATGLGTPSRSFVAALRR